METLKTLFGEWLPDLPDLDNPGLTEAKNVIPSDGGYRPFRPLTSATFGAISATLNNSVTGWPTAAIIPFGESTMPPYVGTDEKIYKYNGSSWTEVTSSTGASAFTQFDNLVIAVGGSFTHCVTVGAASSSNLATTGAAPAAGAVGVVGRFVVLSTIASSQTTLQWSAIDDPRNWPTPGTSTAAATQAGEQIMPTALGAITGIYGGDNYGIILQQGGVSRMQYVGGSVVFQFDVVDTNVGSYFDSGSIMVGGLVYFASQHGFYVTDGISVKPIGDGKVDKYFVDDFYDLTGTQVLACGYDRVFDVVYWSYIDPGVGNPIEPNQANKLLLYHRASGRWSTAENDTALLITPTPGNSARLNTSTDEVVPDLYAFNFSRQFCRFAGTPGTATITTSELETVPGKYSHVSGVKPLIEYSGTAPAVSVSLGTRNDQGDSSLAFSGTTTPTADTGFADFRQSARYHRAKIQITGNFKRATGIELKVTPEGDR